MIDEKRKKEAKQNFSQYLTDGLLKKEKNEIAKQMYMKNAQLSIEVAEELTQSKLEPHLWVIVVSYYSMFYMANAVLLSLGYKTQDKVAHKVTSDALIVLVLDKLKKELVESYESARDDAMEIVSIKAEGIIEDYEHEVEKRSRFQYNMLEEIKEAKAKTSLKRAKEFMFEMRKLLK